MHNYNKECTGCNISLGLDAEVDKRGGIIDLGNKWSLNHYGGQDGFLGWMILQSRFHRMDLADLTTDEAASMGKNIQSINDALRHYWSITFPNDPIQRVYVAYFHESVFGNIPSSQPSQEWHLHIHLIPRTFRLGQLLRRYSDNGSIRAWSIPEIIKLSEGEVPMEYKKTNENMSALVKYLRDRLTRNGSEYRV